MTAAGWLPKVTVGVISPDKLLPPIMTVCPPETGPRFGLTLLTAGGGT